MSQKEDRIIRFSGLKPGKYAYDYTLTDEFFDEWKNDEIRGGKVKIDVEMERFEHMLMFTFTLKGEVTTMCDLVLPESAFEIDLSQWLYEYVAVRIPMQHIHPDGACNPEVTKYIIEEKEEQEKSDNEIDPRWEALKKLK